MPSLFISCSLSQVFRRRKIVIPQEGFQYSRSSVEVVYFHVFVANVITSFATEAGRDRRYPAFLKEGDHRGSFRPADLRPYPAAEHRLPKMFNQRVLQSDASRDAADSAPLIL